MAVNFDKLIIDRVADAWFEDKTDRHLLAVLDDVQNFSVNTSSETKEKTDSMGALIKRYFTAKTVEVSGENAVVSLNLMAIQTGMKNGAITDADVTDIPRIMHIAKSTDAVTLPDAVNADTMIVYGTLDNGLADLDKPYTLYSEGDFEGDQYKLSTVDGKTAIQFANATGSVVLKYQYNGTDASNAIRVNQDAKSFPKECKATFRVLCSDVCHPETVYTFYVVFERFQMSPDFDWTLDTESAQPFTATALKDYCAKKQLLFYVVLDESSAEYDAILDEDINPADEGNSGF